MTRKKNNDLSDVSAWKVVLLIGAPFVCAISLILLLG